MKKFILSMAALLMFSMQCIFAQSVPEGCTDVKDLTGGNEPNWSSYISYPKEFAVQGACFGNGDGSFEGTYVDISDYESISLVVSQGSEQGLAMRFWIWDAEKGQVVTLYAYPEADYDDVVNWQTEYLIKTPGTYKVNVSKYKYLKGIKAANNWGAGPIIVELAYCTPRTGDAPEPEPDPVYEVPAGSTDLADLTGTEPNWKNTVVYPKEFAVQGQSFGNGDGSNESTHMDISAFEKLSFIVTRGSTGLGLRCWVWDDVNNKVVTLYARPEAEFGTTTNWEEPYQIKEPGTYVVNVADYSHLKGVKAANDWGASALVVALAYASPKGSIEAPTQKNNTLSDVQLNVANTTFEATIEGASTAETTKEAKKVANITKFDGTKVTTATFTNNNTKLKFTLPSTLERGDYLINIPAGEFIIDGQAYDKPLQSILAVGEKDEAALNAYENDFANEIETASFIKEDLIYGVNLFQYAPGLKKKIQAEMDEAEYYAELLVEEEHIYNVIAKLRMYMKSLRPILPQTDKEYCIKHKPTGLYLNISGDKVILSENPTPVQFHLTEPSEGPWCWMNNHWTYGYFDEVYYTSHAAYIYTTPERKYLGFNIEEKEVGEGDDKYTYKAPVSTNKKNTVWYIEVNHTNNYEIYIAYDYNNNGGYYDWLYAPSDAEEGADVTCDDKMIGYGDDELVEITPIIDNGNIVITPNNPLPGQVVKPIEEQIPGYMWFIEDYIAPEVPEATPEEPESEDEGMTEIAQSQGKELDDFTRSEFVEGEEYNTYTVNGDLQIAIKMMNVDVEGCDYVVIKFAEPVAAGWKLAFWENQDLTDIPAGATEFKYVFADDPNCGVKDGVLPQICMMTFFGGYEAPLVAKVTGIWKHTAATGDNSSSEEVTSISSVEAAANATAIYNAAGARTNTLQKGINIVKMANGKVVKIMK